MEDRTKAGEKATGTEVYQTTPPPVLTKLEGQDNKRTLEQRESFHFTHLLTRKSIKKKPRSSLLLVKLELDFQYCP